MTGLDFDTFTQQFGRRRALQALGAAAVATASGLTLASAKGGNKKKKQQRKQRKQKRKNLQRRIDQESLALCASQVPECVTLITENCGDNAECVATGQLCCQELADCDFTGLIACFERQNNS